MTHLVVELKPDGRTEPCALCRQRAVRSEGPQLLTADSLDPVCLDCGKKHAPSLVALLDLASTAQRVGRIGRYTLSPPLAALLDLARAAEDYAHLTSRSYQRAAA